MLTIVQHTPAQHHLGLTPSSIRYSSVVTPARSPIYVFLGG